MFILGINSVYHESSACLLKDGKLIAFAEEERFNRVKHGKEALPSNPDELPLESILFCLKKGDVSFSNVDIVAYSFNPIRRSVVKWPKEEYLPNNWGSPEAEKVFLSSLENIQKNLGKLGFSGKVYWIDHQMAHGSSAYYFSPYKNSAILSIDGIGELDTTSLMYGQDESIITLENFYYPNSIGFLWEKFCKFLGFSEYHACKVMGLAAYGDPKVYSKNFDTFLRINSNGTFSIDNDILKFRSNDFSMIEKEFGFERRIQHEELLDHHKNLAATLQEKTNEIILGLADRLFDKCASTNLCLAGGVALNCVSNSHILEHGRFENIFVQPSANDAGTCFGAASFVWHNILRNPKHETINQTYYGPEYSEADYTKVLRENQLKYTHCEDIEKVVAELVSQGNVVGWFQRSMEFGPRALGNRSLIADPRNRNIREVLNVKVKHRELFRPFAPSIMDDRAHEWFDVREGVLPNNFMLMVDRIKSEKADIIPSVIHVDGTARIQRVSKNSNPKYYNMINHFYKITGVPLVLNTSFNDDEPIVCSPDDAVNTFKKTFIDFLVLGNFLVDRSAQTSHRYLRFESQKQTPDVATEFANAV